MVVLRRFGRTFLGVLLGLGLGLSPASLASAAVTPLGEAFPIDDTPDCEEVAPDVAALPGGGFVTVWSAGALPAVPSSSQVYARIYDGGRQPVGPEIRVAGNENEQAEPAVVAWPDGRFLVAWRDLTQNAVFARRFDAAGSPLGGTIQVGLILSQGLAEPPALAALPDGGFAVVWNDVDILKLRRFGAGGQPRDAQPIPLVDHEDAFPGDVILWRPSLALQPGGDLLVVYSLLLRQLSGDESSFVFAQRIRSAVEDPEEWPSLLLHTAADGVQVWGTDVGVDAAGNFVIAWREEGPAESRRELHARRFSPTGVPRGEAFRVDDRSWARLSDPKVLMSPGGAFLAGWSGEAATADPEVRSAVWGRLFDHADQPEEAARQISPADGLHRQNPAFAWTAEREAVAVWQDGSDPFPISIPTCRINPGISARAFSTGCLAGPDRLCLGEGRFQLDATWRAPIAGGSGPGTAVRLTRDTGYFWFFDDQNVELMVKVLDGRALNGNFWVFYGSLSDVAWSLTVTDLVTGASRTYHNPPGRLASRGDTDALPGADGVAVRAFEGLGLDREALPAPWWEARLALPGAGAAVQPVTPPVPPCSDPDFGRRPGLCLNAEEFEVEVGWKDPFNGGAGVGQGVPLTTDSGYFWFFDPANVELVVKVLDGRAVNGRFWVFYGALTNVEYDIVVRHAESGAEKTYHNPPFQFRSRADTAAFPRALP